jgi:hypothetical protein
MPCSRERYYRRFVDACCLHIQVFFRLRIYSILFSRRSDGKGNKAGTRASSSPLGSLDQKSCAFCTSDASLGSYEGTRTVCTTFPSHCSYWRRRVKNTQQIPSTVQNSMPYMDKNSELHNSSLKMEAECISETSAHRPQPHGVTTQEQNECQPFNSCLPTCRKMHLQDSVHMLYATLMRQRSCRTCAM